MFVKRVGIECTQDFVNPVFPTIVINRLVVLTARLTPCAL